MGKAPKNDLETRVVAPPRQTPVIHEITIGVMADRWRFAADEATAGVSILIGITVH